MKTEKEEKDSEEEEEESSDEETATTAAHVSTTILKLNRTGTCFSNSKMTGANIQPTDLQICICFKLKCEKCCSAMWYHWYRTCQCHHDVQVNTLATEVKNKVIAAGFGCSCPACSGPGCCWSGLCRGSGALCCALSSKMGRGGASAAAAALA